MESRRDHLGDRKVGKFWEEQFVQVIIPLGFSGDSITGGLVDDKIIWDPEGNEVFVQIRHKDPYWLGKELRHCYGYERYRLNKDWEISRSSSAQAIYVLHDYTHVGRNSDENRREDWYAQTIEYLYNNIDEERDGPTYYGDSYKIMPICYWQVWRFKPLINLLNDLIQERALGEDE